jgi:hypothetical protein
VEHLVDVDQLQVVARLLVLVDLFLELEEEPGPGVDRARVQDDRIPALLADLVGDLVPHQLGWPRHFAASDRLGTWWSSLAVAREIAFSPASSRVMTPA